jgi:hypothetical protein
MRTVTLHNSGGALLITLLARDSDPVEDAPLRNYDAVQPPGGEVQGAFGDGTFRIGILERELALCNVSGYTTVFHAKAALDLALASTAFLRMDGWQLPIAGVQGVTEWVRQSGVTEPYTLRARIRFIPSSPYWTLIADENVMAVGLL